MAFRSTVLVALLLAPCLAIDDVCDSSRGSVCEEQAVGVSLLQTATEIKGAKPSPQQTQPQAQEEQQHEQKAPHHSGVSPRERRLALQQAAASGSAAPVSFSAAVAEFLAMMLFVVIGCGSAMGVAKVSGYAWVLQVSLTFGFAITVLAYAIGHISGGQINCAVTLGLVLVGHVSMAQGILNVIAQLAGSCAGAYLLTIMYPEEKDLTGNLASNSVGEGWNTLSALIGEIVGTFLLMYVVLETAINPATFESRSIACLAIGLAVFLAHSVLIPIDGCSINPTRSFGPALVARSSRSKAEGTFKDMWIFWAGPLVGAAAAAIFYEAML